MKRGLLLWPSLVVVAALLILGRLPSAFGAEFTTRVSVASDGTQGNGNASRVAVSGDGRYVAFVSSANNLVAGDTNDYADAFVHDRQTGETERVSVASDGTQANMGPDYCEISGDGRYVAFVSGASNLVAGDTNYVEDVFVHDRLTGQTERVSVASNGTQGNGWSMRHAISWDGRYVAFESGASNLVSGDTNGDEDVFVHDRLTGQTERVSVASNGTQGNAWSSGAAISADGRHVAFLSTATNLVGGDTNGVNDIFVRDRQTRQTTRVSVSSAGTQGNDHCYSPVAISADGRYVAFESWATNLVSNDTNSSLDVFVRDRQAGQTTRVSVASDGTQASGGSSREAGISADGRYVVFLSFATNLVSGDTNGCGDIFVHALQTGETELVSVASDGTQVDSDCAPYRAISGDGRHVAFLSGAGYLVPGDTNNAMDCFIRDRVGAAENGFYGWLNTRGKVSLSVTFTDLADYLPSGTVVTAWDWDFGDGGTSTEQNPTHEYTTPGVYTVTLTATTPSGPPLATLKEDYITVSFKDVAICPPDWLDYWALDYILACVEAGVVGGYPNGTYLPTLVVNRDAMAVFISRALAGGDASVPTGPPTATFTDVPTSHWAFKYVEYAVDNSVTGGYPDGTYRPTLTVDRGQMAVFMARAMCGGDAFVPTGPPTASFTDVPTSHWAFKYVEYIRGEGVTGGYPDGTYRPALAVTRDQMAVYVARAFDLVL